MADSTARAFLFDLNGTMIDDMQYHADAWYDIINNDLNGDLTREEVKVQMYGKNEELLKRIFGNDRFTQEEMDNLSMEKERRYQAAYKPKLELINGLKLLLDKAVGHNISLAIGSAAIPFNIDFVLDNLNIRQYFSAIVSADDVKTSKPDPETYLECAARLHVLPQNCIVFEDAPKGVESAQNAGMRSVVLTTMHEEDEFAGYNNILFFVKDYTDVRLMELL